VQEGAWLAGRGRVLLLADRPSNVFLSCVAVTHQIQHAGRAIGGGHWKDFYPAVNPGKRKEHGDSQSIRLLAFSVL
jgi:hypothetical protein